MLLKEEKVNLGRQRELDVVKTLAIFFMVIIHTYEELSQADGSVLCSAPFDVIIQFLGGPLAAPVFMFSLGLGLSYSTHRQPKDLIKRGLGLFLFAYPYNFVRFTAPYLIATVRGTMEFEVEELFYETFHIDILTFAGVAFILTGILKKLKVPVLGVLAISAALQATGLALSSAFEFNNYFTQYFFGIFFTTCEGSYFPLFQWYVYPALGLVFAKYLRHVENTDKLYGGLLAVASALMFSLFAATRAIGYDIRNLFALADDVYYAQTFLHTFFSLLCVIIEISLVHFIIKPLRLPKAEKFVSFMSGGLNKIYIVQWTIIGWLSYLVLDEGHKMPIWLIVPAGIGLALVSALLVWLFGKLKDRKKEKKA